MQGNPSATSDTYPLAIYPQTSDRGRPYIEAQVTGTAAITLAGAIVARLSSNGYLGVEPGTRRASVTALVAGAITDHPIELTPEQADTLVDTLRDAVAVAEGAAGVWGETA